MSHEILTPEQKRGEGGIVVENHGECSTCGGPVNEKSADPQDPNCTTCDNRNE